MAKLKIWQVVIGLVLLQMVGYALLAYGSLQVLLYLIDYAKR